MVTLHIEEVPSKLKEEVLLEYNKISLQSNIVCLQAYFQFVLSAY